MGRTRLLALLACAVVFAVGGVLVHAALRGTSPPATPVPEREFSLSRDEALGLDPEFADQPLAVPTGQDLGPYVNTRPVLVPADQGAIGSIGGEDASPGEVTEPAGTATATDHLYIPSIHVSAPVVAQGVTSANEMSLPDNLHHVGVLDTTSPLDATTGSTLIAGHVTARGHAGALYFLGMVRPGASVSTVDAAGHRSDWVVTSVRSYRKTSLPPEIFDTAGARTLTLVTCGGEIIRTADGRWTHEDNIVVTATPAG